MSLSMHLSHLKAVVISSIETEFGSTDILCGSNSTGCLPSSQSSSLEVHVSAKYLLQTEDGLIVIAIVVVMFVVEVVIVLMR